MAAPWRGRGLEARLDAALRRRLGAHGARRPARKGAPSRALRLSKPWVIQPSEIEARSSSSSSRPPSSRSSPRSIRSRRRSRSTMSVAPPAHDRDCSRAAGERAPASKAGKRSIAVTDHAAEPGGQRPGGAARQRGDATGGKRGRRASRTAGACARGCKGRWVRAASPRWPPAA